MNRRPKKLKRKLALIAAVYAAALTLALILPGARSSAQAQQHEAPPVYGCNGNDTLVSQYTQIERQDCTTYGYCYAYDRNPQDNYKYEYYYGYHQNCPGHKQRTNTVYQCRNSAGFSYNNVQEGYFGACMVP